MQEIVYILPNAVTRPLGRPAKGKDRPPGRRHLSTLGLRWRAEHDNTSRRAEDLTLGGFGGLFHSTGKDANPEELGDELVRCAFAYRPA